MNEKETFKKRYGFNSGSPRWIPDGAELLECIGQRVIRVHFEKHEDGTYTTKENQVIVKFIGNYDPKTFTYEIRYTIPEGENGEEEISDRIIPEGFSTRILGSELGMEGNDGGDRFIPGYIHLKVMQTNLFYARLGKLYSERSTMSVDEMYEIDKDRDQKTTLRYKRNIQAVMEIDGEICSFRIAQLNIKRDGRGRRRVVMQDGMNNTITAFLEEGAQSLKIENIGDVKILDIQDK